MRFCLLLVLILGGTIAGSAQIFPRRPVAIPVDQELRKEKKQGELLAISLLGGVNTAVSRGVDYRNFTYDRLRLQAGALAGMEFVLHPTLSKSVVFGAFFLQERGVLTNYRNEVSYLATAQGLVPGFAGRARAGDLSLSEQWFAGQVAIRYRAGQFTFQPGLRVSKVLGGIWNYAYEETTTAFYDYVTNQVIMLENPLVRSGKRQVLVANHIGFASLIFDVGYQLNPNLQLRLGVDQGITIGDSYSELQQGRRRMSLAIAYELYRSERRD